MKLQELKEKINTLEKRKKNIEEEIKSLEKRERNLSNIGEIRAITRIISTYDLLRETEDEIIDALSNASYAEKLVMLEYFYNQKTVHAGCREFGEFKSINSSSECEKCDKTIKNISKLNLEQYLEYKGKGVYKINKRELEKAKEEIIKKEAKDLESVIEKKKNLEKELEEIEKTLEFLYDKRQTYHEFVRVGINDYEEIEKEMPWLYEKVKEILIPDQLRFVLDHPVESISLDKEKKVAAILYRDLESYYSRLIGYYLLIGKNGKWKELKLKETTTYSEEKEYIPIEVKINEIKGDNVEIAVKEFKESDKEYHCYFKSFCF